MPKTNLKEQAISAVKNYIEKAPHSYCPKEMVFNLFDSTGAPDWSEAIYDYHTMTEQLLAAFTDKEINQRFYHLFPTADVVKPLYCLLDFFTKFQHDDFLRAKLQLYILDQFTPRDEEDLQSIITEYTA